MKKLFTLLVLSLTLTLALAACSPKDSMDKKEDMTKDEEMMDDSKDDMTDESKDDMSNEMKNEGEAAPMLVLNDVNGNEVSLTDFNGKKVYIKYWASWCSICTSGLGEIDKLSENEDFVVLTIVTPGYKGEQSSEDFSTWFNSLDYDNMIVLLDEDGEYSKEFGVIGFPTSVYVGSDGVLVSVQVGHKSNDKVIESMSSVY